ncbi:hypothetical protein D3C77_632980 [compost metagenome]
MRDAARVHHGGPDVVDQLVLHQVLAVPDGVEDLAHGQRRGGVLPDQAEGVLVLGRRGVFHPEQVVGFQRFAQATGFDRRQAVMHVVQQMVLETQLVADAVE